MDLTSSSLSLINSAVSLIASLGIIATLPGARRFLSVKTFRGRRSKRRKLLQRYLRARTVALRPATGLADMAAIACLMILTGFWLLLTAVGLVARRSEGVPSTGADALSMMLMFALLGMSFVRACSVAVEIRKAPREVRRLRAELMKLRYRPLNVDPCCSGKGSAAAGR